MTRSMPVALFLFSAALLGQNETDSAPRKVRPLPAGAVPVKPPPPAPTPAAAPRKPVAAPSRAAAKSAAPVPSQGTSAAEDRVIESKIKAKLAKSKIGLDGFTVRVQGGVAFWDGQTGVVQHKGAATRMAHTAGARQVVNNIRISDAAKQQAMANLAQGRRRDQAKRSEPRSQ